MVLILTKVFTVFSIAGFGLGANKLGILPTESNKYLIALLMNIAMPCLMIISIAGKTMTDETFAMTIQTLAGILLYLIVTMGVCYVLAVALKVPRRDRGVYTNLMCIVNNGFMGLPITQASFGEDALYLMALCNIVQCVWVYTVGFFEITMGSGEFNSGMLRRNTKAMLNPCAIASIIGMTLLFTQTKMPDWLFSMLDSVGQMAVPLSMIVVGVQLGESHLTQVIKNKKLVITAAINLLLIPVLVFLAVYWLPIHDMVKLVLTFGACFPAAVNVVAIASLQRQNATLASEGVALTTVGSMVTLPIAVIALTTIFG